MIEKADEMDTTMNRLSGTFAPVFGFAGVFIFSLALGIYHVEDKEDKLLPQSQHPYKSQIIGYLSEEHAKDLRIEDRIGGILPEEFFEKDGNILYVLIDGKQTDGSILYVVIDGKPTKDFQDIVRYFGK